jgi:hypothetical protein
MSAASEELADVRISIQSGVGLKILVESTV